MIQRHTITSSLRLGRSISTATRTRTHSSRIVRPARNVKALAQPLMFLSLTREAPSQIWSEWTKRFSEKGYESLLVELDPEEFDPNTTSVNTWLDSLEQDFIKVLQRSDSSPFPPLLFSQSSATLLAEQYVSSHPLSGLVLKDPSIGLRRTYDLDSFKGSVDVDVERSSQVKDIIWNEFNYEPGFPIAIIERSENLLQRHRLVNEFGKDGEENVEAWIEDHENQSLGWEKVMRWMDENRL